jgi:hypothetical protein
MTAGIRQRLTAVERRRSSPAKSTLALAIGLVAGVAATVAISLWFLVPMLGLILLAIVYRGEPTPKATQLTIDVTRRYADVRDAMVAVEKRFEPESLRYFFRLLTNLPDFLSSADERARVEPSGLRLETRLTYRVTDGRGPLLVPVLQLAKGVTVDELEILDGDAHPVSAISAFETRGLIASALDFLIEFGRRESGSPARRTADLVTCTDALISVVCRPHRQPDRDLADAVGLALNAFDLNDTWRDRLRRLCGSLARSELVVVQVDRPPESQLHLTYRQLLTYESPLTTKRWRMRLGLAPDTVDSPPMVHLGRAQIYDFQIEAIPGRYIFRHAIHDAESGAEVDIEDLERDLGKVDLRIKQAGVRSHAHLSLALVRSATEEVTRKVRRSYKSVVEYRETSPGALGSATLIASAATAFTVFFALSGGRPSDNADVPALLVALPAFMAIIIGHWSDNSRMPKSSVSAYLGMLGTMVISISAAILYLLRSAAWFRGTEVEVILCCGVPAVHTAWLWLALGALAIVHAVYLWLRLIQGTRSYRRLWRAGFDTRTGDAELATFEGTAGPPSERLLPAAAEVGTREAAGPVPKSRQAEDAVRQP